MLRRIEDRSAYIKGRSHARAFLRQAACGRWVLERTISGLVPAFREAGASRRCVQKWSYAQPRGGEAYIHIYSSATALGRGRRVFPAALNPISGFWYAVELGGRADGAYTIAC